MKRLHHIGIVVDELEEAKRFLGEVMKLELLREQDSSATTGIRTAFFRCGEVEIEVLEMGDPERRRQRLGEGNRARIEHLAIEVDDLPQTIAALSALGIRGATAGPVMLGGRLVWATQADSCDGVMYQFLEAPREASPRAGGGA